MGINGDGWQPDGTGIQSGGHVGGDVQRGGSYGVRFRNAQIPGALVTFSAYAIEDANLSPGFSLEVATEYLLCTDDSRPGETETWSDTTYDNGDGRYWATAEAAELEARLVVAPGFLDEAGSIDWDGEPW